ncbi:hypothetical protein H6G41_17065 [Tolypothrix sp. FACHB-123]|uniref:hypothetical protein n=1 Tax=Tolypothrix sp. FACHB-123 TaxID=2692868 RepID=UPI001683FB89|nr:hypothetical protein [Tolypothrix sp. FACHB-123]MBD2356315.1 hypothetical protein [Tolypothrix sp. FACHB-123]
MLFAPAKTQFSFTLQWTIATFSGFVLSLLFVEIGEKPDVGILQAFIGSLAIASAQMLILKHTNFGVRWLFFTVSAWMAIALMGVGVLGWFVPSRQFFPLRILDSAFSGALGGFVLGIAQWLAIYQSVAFAWRWIFISAVSWAIALAIGSAIGIILRQISEIFLGEVIGLAIAWLVLAILTGINMYILVNSQ